MVLVSDPVNESTQHGESDKTSISEENVNYSPKKGYDKGPDILFTSNDDTACQQQHRVVEEGDIIRNQTHQSNTPIPPKSQNIPAKDEKIPVSTPMQKAI